MTFEAKKREFEREMREGNLAEAERLAVELAPYSDAIAAAEDDKHPDPIPAWGTDAE